METNPLTDQFLLAYDPCIKDGNGNTKGNEYISYDTRDDYASSPQIINNKLIKEITSFFSLNNLFNCIQKDEQK